MSTVNTTDNQINTNRPNRDIQTNSGEFEGIPLCKPSCCPQPDCDKTTCPGCYAKMRKYPKLCPCTNTGISKVI